MKMAGFAAGGIFEITWGEKSGSRLVADGGDGARYGGPFGCFGSD